MPNATITPSANGKKRPSLAEQIDRLNLILDGMETGLNEAVAEAVKQAVTLAVREAVQAAITELLAHPELLQKLAGVAAPEKSAPAREETAASPRQPRSGRSVTWKGLARRLHSGWKRLGSWRRRQGERLSRLRISLKPYRRQLFIAAVVGILAGLATCTGGPWLAAPLGGLGGFFAAVAVQAVIILRRRFPTQPTAEAA